MEDGDESFERTRESPALVNLLVHSGRLTGDALAATVIDLGARGYVKLEQIAPGQVLCRLPAHPHDPTRARLRPHEQQALELLESRAADGIVPAEELTQGVHDEADRWWGRFASAVAEEGEGSGLSRGRFGAMPIVVLGVGALASCLWIGLLLAAGTTDDTDLASLLVAVWIFLGIAGGMLSDGTWERIRLTRDGIALGSRWLTERDRLHDAAPLAVVGAPAVVVRGRMLAYACALGIAPAAARGLPRGPDSTRVAWLHRGGMWRRVRLFYPVRLPRGWGRPPLTTILPGLTGIVLCGAVLVAAVRPGHWYPHPPFSPSAARALGDLEPLVAGVPLVIFVLALSELVQGCLDALTSPRAVEGPVVARWGYEGSRWNPWRDLLPRRWYVVVDDGKSSVLRGLRVSADVYHHAHRGDHMRALVGRRQGFVHEIHVDHVLHVRSSRRSARERSTR